MKNFTFNRCIGFITVLLALLQFRSVAQTSGAQNILNGFAVLDSNEITVQFNDTAQGNIGSTSNISPKLHTWGTVYASNTSIVSTAITQAMALRSQLSGLADTSISNQLSDTLLTAHVFHCNGSLILHGLITLTGDSSSQFIFNVQDSIRFLAGTRIKLVGVLPQNVYWNSGKSICITRSDVYGVLLSGKNIQQLGYNRAYSCYVAPNGGIDIKNDSLYSGGILMSMNAMKSQFLGGNGSFTPPPALIYVALTRPAFDTIETCKKNLFVAKVSSVVGNDSVRIYTGTDHQPQSCHNLSTGTVIRIDSISANAAFATPVDANGYITLNLNASSNSDTISVYFSNYIDCSVFSLDTTATSFFLFQHWKSLNLNNSVTIGNLQSDSITFPFGVPHILKTSDVSYTGSNGNQTIVNRQYTNSGSGTANMVVVFSSHFRDSCNTHVDSLQYKTSNNPVYHTFSSAAPFDCKLHSGEQLQIREFVKVTGCIQCTGTDSMTWHCKENPNNEFCETCNHPFSHPALIANADRPRVVIEKLNPDSLHSYFSCPNSGWTQWSFRITNNGVGSLDTLNLELLNNATDNIASLSLIPDSSFHTFFSGNISRILSDVVTPRTSYLCSGVVPGAFQSHVSRILNFSNSDTLVISFATYDCVSEDTALLNLPKAFNQWAFATIDKYNKNVCGTALTFSDIDYPLHLIPVTKSISTLGVQVDAPFQSYFDMDQQLVHYAPVHDLSVAHNQTFGDIVPATVLMDSIIFSNYDYQLLGCTDFQNPRSCTLKGFIKAKIQCGLGLIVPNPDTTIFWCYTDPVNGHIVKLPSVYYDTQVNGCDSGTYNFYFDLRDANAYRIINGGYFAFQLQACCSSPHLAQTPYQVSFHLLLNPTGSCDTLTFPTNNHTSAPACTGNSCAWLPLSSTGAAIAVHCPGCRAPGIIVNGYAVRRTTLGLEDSDNDKLADNPQKQIAQDTAWYNAHEQLLFLNHVTTGDEFEDILSANFVDGDSARIVGNPVVDDRGYIYDELLTRGAAFKSLELTRKIPGAFDATRLGLKPLEITLYVDALDSSATPNDLLESDKPNAGYRTVLKWRMTKNLERVLSNDVAQSTYFFSFDYFKDSSGIAHGILANDSLIEYSYLTHPFSGFAIHQQYRLKVKYGVGGLFEAADGATTVNDVEFRSEITNTMWLSGRKHNVDSLSFGQMPNSRTEALAKKWSFVTAIPPDTLLVSQGFADQFRFYCETFGGFLYQVSQDWSGYQDHVNVNLTNHSIRDFKPAPCNDYINIHYNVRIASNCLVDFFPYEYRTPILSGRKLTFTLPPGFHTNSGYALSDFKDAANYAGRQIPNAALVTNANGLCTYSYSSIPPFACKDETFSATPIGKDSTFFSDDNRTTLSIFFQLAPDSCHVADFKADTLNPVTNFDVDTLSCSTASDFRLASPFVHNHIAWGNEVITHRSDLQMQVDPIALSNPIATNNYCLPFNILFAQNTASVQSLIDAPNVFLAVDTSSLFDNWYFKNTTTTISITHGIALYDSMLSHNSTKHTNDSVCFHQTSCFPDSLFQMHFTFGWNCSLVDSLYKVNGACFHDTLSVKLHSVQSALDADNTHADPNYTKYSLCSAKTFEFKFQSTGDGAIQADSISLSGLPVGISVNSVVLSACNGTLRKTLAATANNTWAINLAPTDSLFPIPYKLGACYMFQVTVNPSCHSGTTLHPIATLYGKNYCGKKISLKIDNQTFIWDSTGYCSKCYTITKTANVAIAQIGQQVTFTIQVCGHNAATSTVQVKEILPSDFQPSSSVPTYTQLQVPANACASFTVSGYFTSVGSASNPTHVNKAILYTDSLVKLDSASTGVHIVACLDSSFALQSGDSISMTRYAAPNNLYQDSTFVLEGDFIINSDWTFRHCHIIAAPRSRLIVRHERTLTLDSTLIEGCSTMWQGIVVEDSMASIVVTHHSNIHDAEAAITMSNKIQTLRIENSSLEDCLRGIYFPYPQSVALHVVNYFTVKGTKFGLSSTDFKPDYPNQPKHQRLPYSGIELNHTGPLQIGGKQLAPNTFSRLYCGILSEGGITTVQNAQFDSILTNSATVSMPSGYAIIARDGRQGYSVIVVESGAQQQVHIANSDGGILADTTCILADSIYMQNVTKTGIRVTDGLGFSHNVIQHCEINAKDCGIFLSDNAQVADLKIKANSIRVSSLHGTGIYGGQSATSVSEKTTIEYNDINVDQAQYGIHLLNMRGLKMHSNHILVNENPYFAPINGIHGIAIDGGEKDQTTCNAIVKTSKGTSQSNGITVNSHANGLLSCNITSGNYRGVFFGGPCDNSKFKGNEMANNWRGLEINSTGSMDLQDHHGNLWYNYTDQFGAYNWNYNPQTNLVLSKFKVSTPMGAQNAQGFEYYPNLSSYNSTWFEFDPFGGIEFSCTDSLVCLEPDTCFNCGILPPDRIVASDSLYSAIYNNEIISQSRQILYEKLMADTSLISTDQLFTNFMLDHQNDIVGRLFDVSNTIQNSYQYPDYIETLLHLTDSLLEVNQDSLIHASELCTTLSIPDCGTWQSTLETRFEGLLNTRHTLNLIHDGAAQQEIADAMQQNQQLVPIELPEINLATISDIYLQFVQEGIMLIREHNQDIKAIANQCPYAGGQAVYQARALLKLIDDTTEYNDAAVCLQSGIFRMSEIANASEQIDFILSPNPASETVRLSFTKPIEFDEPVKVTIQDIQGRILLE